MKDNIDLNKNRSLSADADFRSAFEYFRNGEYRSSLNLIEKKLPKLNSQLDKFNFNMLLSLIYSRTYRQKDSEKILENLKNEMIKFDYVKKVPETCDIFKNFLREMGNEKMLKEIFDLENKNLNLSKIEPKQQKEILKELTINLDMSEIYTKVNIFLKSENLNPEISELFNLIKYEAVYNLVFKYKKLSKFIGNAIFKEMNQKFENLKNQKGFLDIYIKFILGLNEKKIFLEFFENKKNSEIFTNAPINDLMIDIYFKNSQSENSQKEILMNFLISSIKENLMKCNFVNFSRLICFFFYDFENFENSENSKFAFLLEKENCDSDSNSNSNSNTNSNSNFNFNLNFTEEKFFSFSFSGQKNFKENFLGIFSFLSFIKNEEMKKKNFNTYKSAILGLLMFWHFLRISVSKKNQDGNLDLKDFNELIEENIFLLISELLESSINKHSILMELSKYFVYLNEKYRNILLEKFDEFNRFKESENLLSNDNNSNIAFDLKINNDNEIEGIIFFEKLRKLLKVNYLNLLEKNYEKAFYNDKVNSYSDSDDNCIIYIKQELTSLKNYVDKLINLYFSLTKNSKKIQKGERILGDDLVILANEAFFEALNKLDNEKNENDILLINSNDLAENKNEKNKNLLEINDTISNILYRLYSLNFIAYERSPYNYDISIFFLKLCGYMGLNIKTQTILTTMNLKGPQFESVSYIANKHFFENQYKDGMSFISSNLEKWQKDNKKCGRKTLWKMFTGRNFFDAEELLDFLNENENTYYKLLIEFQDLTNFYINPNMLISQNQQNQSQNPNNENLMSQFLNYFESLNFSKEIFREKISNKNLIKNQDALISIFKNKYVKHTNELNTLRKNINSNKNFNNQNYQKFEIDKIYKENLIFEKSPGFKSNFFTQNDTPIFGIFENEEFLMVNFYTNLLKIFTKVKFCEKNLTLKEKENYKENILEQENSIKNILENLRILLNEENKKKMEEDYLTEKNKFLFVFEMEKIFVDLFTWEFSYGKNGKEMEANKSSLEKLIKNFNDFTIKSNEFIYFKNNYKSFNQFRKINLINKFKFVMRFYFPSLVLITGKILNFVNLNNTEFENPTDFKGIINNNFKSSWLNFLGNLENLNNESDEVLKIEKWVDYKEFNEFGNLPSKLKVQIRKNNEENTKEIKEIVKQMIGFIKENM